MREEFKVQHPFIPYKRTLKLFIDSLLSLKQEVTAKYERYRDVVEVLPSCQMELQLCQKKMEIQGENVERLTIVSSEVCIIQIIYC